MAGSFRLQLRFEPDTDGTGALWAQVQHEGFAGLGSAWFGQQQIAEFGRQLAETFPITPGQAFSLRGGYGHAGGNPPALEDVLLSIEVYAIDTLGSLGVRVDLKQGLQQSTGDIQRPASRAAVGVELLTDHTSVQGWGRDLIDMVERPGQTAVLEGAADG